MLSVILALLLFCSSGITVLPVAAAQQTADNANFDVMFVMDFSGTMLKSDKDRCRVRAGQMFADIARTDTSRMGYVQFTNVILSEQELQPVTDAASAESFRNALGSLADASADVDDTDISLGLTRALELMENGGSFNGDRNPAIVLLSDGNTDLPNGPRTAAESNAELETTLNELAAKGVPVYSVGLNYDNSLDTVQMNDIASKTGGSYYDIKNAEEFNEAMNNIFGDLTGTPGTDLVLGYDEATGRYTTSFEIDSSNILQANIVVLTSLGVSDPQIIDPNGSDVTNDSSKVLISTDQGSGTSGSSSYMVMKVLRPENGTWYVSVLGDKEDAINITLLTTFDAALTLEGSGTADSGKPYTVRAFMADQDGSDLQDAELLQTSVVELSVLDENGVQLPQYQGLLMTYDPQNVCFTAELTLDSGKYYATAELTSSDGTMTKTSNSLAIGVNRIVMELKDPSQEITESMWTAPIDTTASFNLKDLLVAESLDGLAVRVLPRDDSAENIIDTTYDEATKEVTLHPIGTGNLTEKIEITNPAYGDRAVLEVQVKCRPVWPFFVIGAAVLFLIILVIVLVKRAKRPVLKGAVSVELVLPPMFMNLTTSPQTINMPAKAYKANLAALIQGDPMALASFQESIARTGIIEILKKIEFVPAKDGTVNMRILPKAPGKIYVNNQLVNNAKGITCQFSKSLRHTIQCSTDGTNSTTIHLSMQTQAKNPWSGSTNDSGAPFGSGAGSFGDDTFGGVPFGGGQNNAPFGGGSGFGGTPFGGGSQTNVPFGGNGGFGGSSFGNENQGGFSGGFGSGSPDGYSGGFGSGNQGSYSGGNQGSYGSGGQGGFAPGTGNTGNSGFDNGAFGGQNQENSFDFGDDDDKTLPGGFF